MPSQQEVRWSQLKVGVIVLVASVVLVTLLFLMTSASGLGVFSHKLTITTYFENSAGLKEGAAVNLEGVTIGTVKSVTVVNSPDRKLTPVKVVMKLDEKYASNLKKDSKASLTTVGVLGDTVVDINSQFAVGPPLQDGDELKTLETPSLTDVVKASQGTIESLNVILAKMNVIVDNLQSGKGSVGQLINNPDLYNKANATVDELLTLEKNLNNGRGSIGKLMTDDTMYNRLNDAAGKLENIANDLNSGKGTAGMLLKDDSLYKNLNSTLVHANSIMADADAGKGGLGLMLKDPKFRQELSNTLTQVNTLVTGINDGKGTLGKLTTDDSGIHQPEQAADRKHRSGDDDPQGPEEVSDDPYEDLLERDLRYRAKSSGCGLDFFVCPARVPAFGADQYAVYADFMNIAPSVNFRRAMTFRSFATFLVLSSGLCLGQSSTAGRDDAVWRRHQCPKSRSASTFRRSTRRPIPAPTSISTPAATGRRTTRFRRTRRDGDGSTSWPSATTTCSTRN